MTKVTLAIIAAASIAGLAALAEPAAAIEYPWCAQYNGADSGGARNCGFVSYEQCMWTIRGAGGSCEENLFYLDSIAKKPQPARKRQRER